MYLCMQVDALGRGAESRILLPVVRQPSSIDWLHSRRKTIGQQRAASNSKLRTPA